MPATYGGFWRRLLAYLLDRVIVETVSLATAASASFVTGAVLSSPGAAAGQEAGRLGLFFLAYAAAAFAGSMAYFTWFHGNTGQTPGKMALGLKVIQANGGRLSFGGAFLRWSGSIVSALSLGLGYLWIAVDRRKQGWHDKIAATLVVRTGRPGPFDPGESSASQPQAAQ